MPSHFIYMQASWILPWRRNTRTNEQSCLIRSRDRQPFTTPYTVTVQWPSRGISNRRPFTTQHCDHRVGQSWRQPSTTPHYTTIHVYSSNIVRHDRGVWIRETWWTCFVVKGQRLFQPQNVHASVDSSRCGVNISLQLSRKTNWNSNHTTVYRS